MKVTNHSHANEPGHT